MRIISTLKPAKIALLISAVVVIPQKGRPRNVCEDFSGVTPQTPSEYGPAMCCVQLLYVPIIAQTRRDYRIITQTQAPHDMAFNSPRDEFLSEVNANECAFRSKLACGLTDCPEGNTQNFCKSMGVDGKNVVVGVQKLYYH